MEWDAVERELVIVARDLSRTATSLRALAAELCKEREFATTRAVRGREPGRAIQDNDRGPEARLLFPREGDE